MVADLSQEVPDEIKDEVNALLTALGNDLHAIPFYAYFPAGGGDPVVIGDGPLLQNALIENLENAIRETKAKVVPVIGEAMPISP